MQTVLDALPVSVPVLLVLFASVAFGALVGTVAGVMDTTSSVGGPPLAFLYQREPGPILRSTLGATFLLGAGLSLTALTLADRVHPWHWALGIALTPAVGIGLVLSRGLHGRVDAAGCGPVSWRSPAWPGSPSCCEVSLE